MSRVVNFITGMEWVYEQSTGCLYLRDSEDVLALVARGYSGKGEGKNNPEAESQRAVGPVPRGVWRLAAPVHHKALGPIAIRLSPTTYQGTRTGFLIHGDNSRADGSASEGCIILDRRTRQFIAATGIDRLVVI